MVFFRFFEPYGFLNRERISDIDNLTDQISARLYGLTYWGDYGGDSYSRYHYDLIQENAPHLTRNLSGNHGDALILDRGGIADMVSLVFESDENVPVKRDTFDAERAFLKDFFQWALGTDYYGRSNRDDFPIYDENGYSDWEYNKIQEIAEEDLGDWILWETNREIDKLTNHEGEHAEPEEIRDAFNYLMELSEEYPYFETATSVVYPAGIDAEHLAQRIVDKRNGDVQLHQDDSLF